MTSQPDCTLSDSLLEPIAATGLDSLPELIRIIINTAMQAEHQQHLGSAPYQRTPERRDAAILIVTGVDPQGKRQVPGVSVALSEQEIHWRLFLQSLVARGMGGIQLIVSDAHPLIVSDAHPGLQAARQAVFGGVPWQRCQFHLQQNASAYVPRQEMKADVAAAIRAIFNAANRAEADALLAKTIQHYAQRAPRLATWLEMAIPEGLTVFAFPERHRRVLRTTNGVERLNREIKRRTRVVAIFPNEASCLRLVSAILMEISEDWETGKTYLNWID